MTFFNPCTVVTRRSHNVRSWMALDEPHEQWVVEITVRRPGGILYYVNRYAGERPSARALYRDACRYGHFSPRPYRLAQPCDGSITTCALALFIAFCEAHRLDPIELLRQAYPDPEAYTLQNIAEIREAADWEGVAYPSQWDPEAIDGLLESLHEINYHSLASVVATWADSNR